MNRSIRAEAVAGRAVTEGRPPDRGSVKSIPEPTNSGKQVRTPPACRADLIFKIERETSTRRFCGARRARDPP
jgi:hypothetical protein